jgi:hypothetical protein
MAQTAPEQNDAQREPIKGTEVEPNPSPADLIKQGFDKVQASREFSMAQKVGAVINSICDKAKLPEDGWEKVSEQSVEDLQKSIEAGWDIVHNARLDEKGLVVYLKNRGGREEKMMTLQYAAGTQEVSNQEPRSPAQRQVLTDFAQQSGLGIQELAENYDLHLLYEAANKGFTNIVSADNRLTGNYVIFVEDANGTLGVMNIPRLKASPDGDKRPDGEQNVNESTIEKIMKSKNVKLDIAIGEDKMNRMHDDLVKQFRNRDLDSLNNKDLYLIKGTLAALASDGDFILRDKRAPSLLQRRDNADTEVERKKIQWEIDQILEEYAHKSLQKFADEINLPPDKKQEFIERVMTAQYSPDDGNF